MDKLKEKVTITAKLPWWFNSYIYTLALFCVLFGTEADPQKIESMVRRHIKFKIRVE